MSAIVEQVRKYAKREERRDEKFNLSHIIRKAVAELFAQRNGRHNAETISLFTS